MKHDGSLQHKPKFFSGTIPFFLILFLYIFCTGIASAQSVTQSATLSFSHPSLQVKEGDKFTIEVMVNSPEESINAVSGTVVFPGNLVHVLSLNKDDSLIKLWTQEPKLRSDNILFEGVILNPGFQGNNGPIFSINFEAETTGRVDLNFNEGAVLANNGLGTNVLATLGSSNFDILPAPTYNLAKAQPPTIKEQVAALPVITKYFPALGPQEYLYVQGKGTPFALTQISFQNLSVKSLGDKFVALFQGQKNTLGVVTMENDKSGNFHYLSNTNLVAGVYNATPALVDPAKNTTTPGTSVQLLVSDSMIVKYMVVLLNILGLLVPIVLLVVIIYFIPWFSFKRMRIMKEKMKLEEEKVEITEEELKQKTTIQPPTQTNQSVPKKP